MNDATITQCTLPPNLCDKPVLARLDQHNGSSDGGAALLKVADRRLGLLGRLAGCLRDDRQPGKVDHELGELPGQRVFAIACGHEDANDAARPDQLRVLMTAASCILMQELRLRLARTSCARFQVSTLRERFITLAVHLVISVRRIVLHLPDSFPLLDIWNQAAVSMGAKAGSRKGP